MASLICAILAAVCFFLALISATVGIDLVVLGFLFMALAMVFGSGWVTARWNR